MSKITYKIECLPEDVPIRGNAMASGNKSVDKRVEDVIIAQLEAGSPWAWCTVRVTAHCGGLVGEDFLGCCNYRDEAEFTRPGSYYDDMKTEAKADLLAKLETASSAYSRLI